MWRPQHLHQFVMFFMTSLMELLIRGSNVQGYHQVVEKTFTKVAKFLNKLKHVFSVSSFWRGEKKMEWGFWERVCSGKHPYNLFSANTRISKWAQHYWLDERNKKKWKLIFLSTDYLHPPPNFPHNKTYNRKWYTLEQAKG